jgi:DNA-binding NarL/FixJ family response regulator
LLRRAVSGMECINVTRQVLRINPDASPVEVAEAVALELGKNWPTLGSKRRNGGAIMRYAVWLEPHLLDETTSSEAAYRIAYALDTKLTPKGRPQSLMRKHEPELRRLLAEGLTNTKISKHFNVSPATIRNWRLKLDLL